MVVAVHADARGKEGVHVQRDKREGEECISQPFVLDHAAKTLRLAVALISAALMC